MERLVVDRFNNHASAYHLLPANNRRTGNAENVSVLVLLDLSAAFDTVDHDVLLDVLLKRFDVVSKAFDWCKSYLSERTQSFCVASGTSNPVRLTCSVPQGSVIGPVKFIAYT